MKNHIFSKLSSYMNSSDYVFTVNKEKELNNKLNGFINKYTPGFLRSLPLEDYVEDKSNPNSFCFIMDKVLDFGRISNIITPPKKFVLFRKKDTNTIQYADNGPKKGFSHDISILYKQVIECIIDVIEAVKNNDYDAIHENMLCPQYKNKLAYLYSNHTQIPIYSKDHLKIFFSKLGLNIFPKETLEQMRERLYDYYEENIRYQFEISPYIFMCFLYNEDYGFRSFVFQKESSSQVSIKDNKLSEEDISVPQTTHMEVVCDPNYEQKTREGKKSAKAFKLNVERQINQIEIGKKGEEIVKDYLNNPNNGLNVKEGSVIQHCGIDDSKGYDFEYMTNTGEIVYVEVKTTTRNLNSNIYFEMSSNEYQVMKQNINNYKIFFINNVRKERLIRIINGVDIVHEKPSKYEISFPSIEK